MLISDRDSFWGFPFCWRFAFLILLNFQCTVTTEDLQLSSQLKTFIYPVISIMLLFHTLEHVKLILYVCILFFFILPLPVFLPFLNVSSSQKSKTTKIHKSESKAGNITQRFCRAIKLCIMLVKIYTAIMGRVTFEIKSNF